MPTPRRVRADGLTLPTIRRRDIGANPLRFEQLFGVFRCGLTDRLRGLGDANRLPCCLGVRRQLVHVLQEQLEAELYAVLARRLPNTTIVSIGHRSAVVRLHRRHLAMQPADDVFVLRDATEVASAS